MHHLLFIGHLSLNLSFVLYLILYLPQVLHNRKSKNIAELSLAMHYLLLTCYLFDLFYGFLSHFQWQYKTVSMVGLSLLCIQHVQLTYFLFHHGKRELAAFNLIVGSGCVFALYSFFMMNAQITTQTVLLIGCIARICSFSYCLPQIFRNHVLKSAAAINIQFIYLNTTLAILDTISGWCLNWGWPNKLASPLTVIIMMILLFQHKRYNLSISSPIPATHPSLPIETALTL